MTLPALAYGPSPLSLTADTPVREVLRRLLEQRINHVACAAPTRFAGLVSVRGLLSRIIPAAAVISAVVDNIPFVATMIAVVGAENLNTLWWSLARRLPVRQRQPGLGIGQPGGGRFRRAGRPSHPLPTFSAGGLSAHADEHRRIQPLYRLALPVSGVANS